MKDLKVDIAIVGFQKAGTTSILKYLAQQDEIQAHPQKEMTYFSSQAEFDEGWELAQKRYFYSVDPEKKLLIKHATLIRHESSIKRLYEHNPKAKIIVSLRDPAERAYSSYLMEKSNGNQTQSFSEVVKEAFENHQKGESDWRYNVFIKLGEYVNYIDILVSYFGKKSVYILNIEDFHKNKEKEFTRLCQWLKIETPRISVVQNQHNEYKEARSGLLAKTISSLLREGSIVKRTFKKIIPLERQALMGEQIRNFVKRKAVKEPLDNETREFLNAHYVPYQKKLNEKYISIE
ncbi:sulfotransferase family protein [Marivirga arenosa]|uniref:Sulfotransferase n=1 Tax=Marivirga arenosa TaxID=3059076 RepID=A0AA49GEU3_9BACT|nr:sulfotransferase [Marivirga sp. BKB1-2]WKK82571.2 sulfotransferase [Marivirga sp. BKB1-2]